METKKSIMGFAVAGIIVLLIASGAFAQPSVHDIAGTAKLNGNGVTPGTLIVAKDANGTEMGNFTVTATGFYGIMHINGDDPDTTGDSISFFINGVQAQQTLIWQPFAYDPGFSLTACDLSTYSITVQTNAASYFRGQDMIISGYLMNSQCTLEPNKSVAYSVPSTAIVGQTQTNGTGYFTVTVTIPSDMPFGQYTVWASYPPAANETVFSTANFSVVDQPSQPVVVTSTGGGGGGGGCVSSWICGDWSACQADGTQSRTCNDTSRCGTTFGKPNETQSCTYTPPAAAVCTPGEKACSGLDLMECSSEGQWIKIQQCDYQCAGNACVEKPAESGPGNETTGGGASVTGAFLLEPSAWPYWVLIAFVIILIAWYLMRRRKKKASVSL